MSMEPEKGLANTNSIPRSCTSTPEDKEVTYSLNGVSTASNIDSLSQNPSPILEIDEPPDLHEDTATCNDISEISNYENEMDDKSSKLSKESSIDSACSSTEKIMPIINVESSVNEKTKQVPSLRRTFSEYAPFKMDSKNRAVFGSQEALPDSNTIKTRKVAPDASLRRKSVEKPSTVQKPVLQRKPLHIPNKRTEKAVGTELKDLTKIEPRVDSIRKQMPKPRSQIVAAVTHRLYSKSKKKEIGTDTDDLRSEKGSPRELNICSNARLKLKELTQKALRAHRYKDGVTQTDLFPVLRVKEISTDVSDLRECTQEVKDVEILHKPSVTDNATNCCYLDTFEEFEPNAFIRNALIVTKTCSTQVDELLLEPLKLEDAPQKDDVSQEKMIPPLSFTKYLQGNQHQQHPQHRPTLLESLISNPIYTNSVNINISHNYGNSRNQNGDDTPEDSLENENQENICCQPPDLISNHNSLEPHNSVSVQVPESSECREVLPIKTRFSSPNFLQDHYLIAEEFSVELPTTFICHYVTIPNNCVNISSVIIPSVHVAETHVVEDKDDRCLPIPVFRPETAKPKITEYQDFKCDDCIVLKEPILMKSIMKQLPKKTPHRSSIGTSSQSESSEDSTQSEREIPDSLDYHMANSKKVRFGKNRKHKKGEMLQIMSNFFEEASVLMNNLTVATNKLEGVQTLPNEFDLEVSISDISCIKSCAHSHRKRRKKQPEAKLTESNSTQTESKGIEGEGSQTVTSFVLGASTQYDCEVPVNKYETLLEDSCRRLEEKIDAQPFKDQRYAQSSLAQQMDELYLEDDRLPINERNLTYNPWDLTSINYDFSSLESNPVTFSDYGSLPRRYPKRQRTSSCSPSAYLRQLTNMRKQVIESSREELLNSESLK